MGLLGQMMQILKLLLIIFIMILGTIFSVLNSEPVPFNYYFGALDLPLSLVIVTALGVGIVVGILSGIGMLVNLKWKNAALKRHTSLVSQEVNNLRTIPLKDE